MHSSHSVQHLCTPTLEVSAMASSSSSGAAPVAKPRPEPRRTEVRKYMKQDKKGQRAEQLKGIVGIHGTSLASMRHILNSVVDEGERLTVRMLRDIAHAGFAEVRRDVTFPLADEGGEVVVPVADPSSLVAMSVRASETMQEVFVAAMQHHPGTPEAPWHLWSLGTSSRLAACTTRSNRRKPWC